MDAVEDPVAVVAGLWEEHRSEPWPKRLDGLEVAGVDLASLETRLGGCTYTWVTNGGSLHERGTGTVRFLLGELDRILPELTEDDSPQIWHRLHRMSRLVVAHNTPPAGTPS